MKRLRQLTNCLLIVVLGALSMVASAQDAKRDEVVFFFNDALGSAVAAINEQGDLCWSEEYTGYGDKTINDDLVSPVGCGIIGEERGFTGHTEDVNSDLVYMQQRYYDPSIGRFLSIDPMDADPNNPMTYNRYAYGNNNPYKYVDPDGELPFLAYAAYVGVTAAITAYDSYKAYQEGGVGALAKEGLANAAMAAIPGGQAIKATGTALDVGKSVAQKLDDVPNSGPIWSNNKKFDSVGNAFDHWKRHKSEFPEFKNAKQYVEGTKKFFDSPPAGTLTKTRKNGDVLQYNPSNNTFGVQRADGAPRTMFRPKDGIDYWNKQ